MCIYIHVQPNMVNLLAKTFRYFSDEYLTKLEVGAWRQWMDIAATSVSRLGVFFFTPGPFDLTPRVYQCLSLLEQSQNIVKKTVYQCLSFINVWLVTEHTNKTAVQLVDVYCSHFWTKPCGSTKLKRGSWKNDVIQKNHRFLMTRPWHLCSSLEVSVRWQWGAPL